MRRHLRGILVLLLTTVASSASAGLVVVNNLDQIEAADGTTVIWGGGIPGGERYAVATQFTVGSGIWSIDAVTVRMFENASFPNDPDEIVLRIMSDNAGTPGSTVLGSLSSTTNILGKSNYVFEPLAPITLASGSYWLGGFPTPFVYTTQYGWQATNNFTDNGTLGWSIGNSHWRSTNDGSTWAFNSSQPHMFNIEATAVPEPSSLIQVCGALAVSTSWFKRRRHERKV